MGIIYYKIGFVEFFKILLNKKKTNYFFIIESLFINNFLFKLILKNKNVKKLDWNYNNLKEGAMLLGYKIEVHYLNEFINYIIDYNNRDLDNYLKLNLKKKFLDLKLFGKFGLYEVFFIIKLLEKNTSSCSLYLPNNLFIDPIKSYCKKNYKNIVIIKYQNFNFFYEFLIKKIKFIIKRILEFKNLIKTPLLKNNSSKSIISLEIALNAFNPLHIFNKLDKDNFWIINKTHKLSQKDKSNLIQSKKNFYPLYNQRKFFFLKTFIKNNSLHEINNKSKYKFDFFDEYNKWLYYFYHSNTKVYVTSYKYTSHIIPASCAINHLGGISCMFQTSFYEKTTPFTVFHNDLYFSFSNKFNNAENLIGSKFKYNISVGYIYDYKFEKAKEKSKFIRNKILHAGAKRIVAFFDQGAVKDDYFTPGFVQIKQSYEFILNKLINNQWLGLVIKPKKPSLLKESLGEIYNLLLKAVKTGRCHIYMESDEFLSKNFENPPSEAAFASDIVIHNCLVAGTAGLEGALTGKNVFYYDYFGFEESIFYKNKEKIVFNNWDILWKQLKFRLFNEKIDSNKIPQIFRSIDDFCDNRSFERIEDFSNNLLEGFKLSNQKSLIIENAINKYTNKWGTDKVIQNF